MQTTLDCPATSSAIKVEKPTFNYTDEHINYLYNRSSEGILAQNIKGKLAEEQKQTDELKEEFEYLQQFKEFRPKRKPQKFIRIGGKRC